MSNVSSGKIHVFPFGSTRKDDVLGRVLNEYNISQLVKNLTDKPNYVTKFTYENKMISTIDFVIQGYYFSVDLTVSEEELSVVIPGQPLYAYIEVSPYNNSRYSFLRGGDNSEDVFTGVHFVTDINSLEVPPNVDFYLQLLDSDGNVPESSRIRFNSDSFSSTPEIDRIYCGNSYELI